MTFQSKEIKNIYHKITRNDALLAKYLVELKSAFEAAGIIVEYNFSDYVQKWDGNRVLYVLSRGLHNKEEDRRPLKNGDFEECYFIYVSRGDELYAYYHGDEFIKKVKSFVKNVTEHFNKSEQVFDDYFNPEDIDEFNLEMSENANVCQIAHDYFSWYCEE